MADGDYGWDEQIYGYDETPVLTYSYAAGGNNDNLLASFGPKKPPVFSPSASFFRYEKDVRDWLLVTQATPEQCGISLLLNFHRDAGYLKNHIDRNLLKRGLSNPEDKQSQNEGV